MQISWIPERRASAVQSFSLCLLCVLFVATVLRVLNTHYTTNDDTGIISFIVAGYPVPYMGIALSTLLHAAYAAVPSVAWFGCCLYALLTLSLYQWLALAWRVFPRPWLAAAATAVILGLYLDLLVSLDFTAVSAMLCMSALSRAGVEVLGPGRQPWALLVPGLVFAAGWLVRPDPALGALAYALPVGAAVLVACLWRRPLQPEAVRLALAALVFLLPLALNLAVDDVWRASVRTPLEAQYEARNEEIDAFYHLNAARREATGRDAALLASLHWTVRDSRRFLHWKFLDERVYTPQAVHALVAGAAAPAVSAPLLERHLRGRLFPHNTLFLLLLASLPLFVLLLCRGRPEGAIGLLLPFYSVALTVLMYVLHAYVYRVEMPFELGLGLMGVLLATALLGRSGAPPSRVSLAVACVSLLIAGVAAGYSVRSCLLLQRHDLRVAATVRRELQMLDTRFAGDVVLMQPVGNGLNVLSPLQPVLLRFDHIDLGWSTFSPLFYDQIRVLGVQHGYELMDAMVDDPRAYLRGWQPWAQQLSSYATAHQRGGIEVVQVAPRLQQLRSGGRAAP
jgi:hypothetical protein